MAKAQAADALMRGTEAVGDAKLRAGKMRGEQVNAAGGSGLELSGTASSVVADSELIAATDQARLKANAAREAWGYDVQADNYTNEATLAKKRGQMAVLNTILGGVGASVGTMGTGVGKMQVPSATTKVG